MIKKAKKVSLKKEETPKTVYPTGWQCPSCKKINSPIIFSCSCITPNYPYYYPEYPTYPYVAPYPYYPAGPYQDNPYRYDFTCYNGNRH